MKLELLVASLATRLLCLPTRLAGAILSQPCSLSTLCVDIITGSVSVRYANRYEVISR